MRPLTQREWTPALSAIPASLAVQDGLGRYCAICERPLPEGGVAWDTRAEREVLTVDAGSWPHVMVLCRVCAAYGALTAHGATPMALPLRHATFALGAADDPPHFAYEPQTLQAPGGAVKRVVVVPQSREAAETVRRFALNGGEPLDDDVLVDWRVEDRTRAWQAAEEAAADLEAVTGERDRALLLRVQRLLVAQVGCWSVWATVLGRRLGDRGPLEALLLPPNAEATIAEHAFAGTRVDG